MTARSAQIAIADDDAEMCRLLVDDLHRLGYAAESRSSADEAQALVLNGDVDVLVTDLRMRGRTGLDLCDAVVASRPDVPVIVMTAFGSLETAIATLRAGAFDFLIKPFEVDTLVIAIERALSQRRLREEVKRLRRAVQETRTFDDLIGASTPMREVYALVDRVADSDATVLVTGESGTGKELVARSLHRRGKRRAGPLVAVNCAALPEALLESELFGHAKGAFTDAREKRVGLLPQASGGTLFLDEIGEMPPAMQAKLLRALETRTVRPVGANAEIPFDVRIVAATNRDLEADVEEQRFREDLLYRLNVLQIEMPPLRARGGDVLLLAQAFLERFAAKSGKPVERLSSAVGEKLLAYPWPGNVRELQNCIERAVALARYEEISADDLPPRVRDFRRSHVLVAADDPSELVSMAEVERRYVLRVLEAAGGNKNQAARILGWDRKTLYRHLERREKEKA
ncbi:MAG TPA: sigma-54 dependent transcriptional regulator [Polyangiaceae bacterium]